MLLFRLLQFSGDVQFVSLARNPETFLLHKRHDMRCMTRSNDNSEMRLAVDHDFVQPIPACPLPGGNFRPFS